MAKQATVARWSKVVYGGQAGRRSDREETTMAKDEALALVAQLQEDGYRFSSVDCGTDLLAKVSDGRGTMYYYRIVFA